VLLARKACRIRQAAHALYRWALTVTRGAVTVIPKGWRGARTISVGRTANFLVDAWTASLRECKFVSLETKVSKMANAGIYSENPLNPDACLFAQSAAARASKCDQIEHE
jgi:hypothetical protein